MEITIRNAAESDFTVLCSMYEKPYGGLEIAGKFVRMYLDHYFWKLVEVDGKIMGGLIWFPRESPKLGWAEILDIWVDENYRRRGLGSKLMTETIKDIESYHRSFGHRTKCVILFTPETALQPEGSMRKPGSRRLVMVDT